jgi:hypothetical protein
MAIKKFIDSTGLATLWEKIKALIPGIATSSKAGIVKSGGDITVASDGVVSVNDNSHNHFYEKGVFYGEFGAGGYVNFCTITVSAQYRNEPFTLDLSSRGRLGTLTINLGTGASTTITAPSLVWISDLIEASPIWYKVSGNMLYLYWQKSEVYDELSVTGLNVGLYTNKGVTFSWGNTYVTATTGLKNVPKSNYKVNCYSFNDANVSGYTIDSFWVELLYKSGCVGSVYLFKKSSGVGSEIVEGWYNFVYMPYGNGVSAAGYRSYGSIILTPMTMSTSSWALRVTNSASTVTEAIKLSKYGISDISGLQAALDGYSKLNNGVLNITGDNRSSYFNSSTGTLTIPNDTELVCFSGYGFTSSVSIKSIVFANGNPVNGRRLALLFEYSDGLTDNYIVSGGNINSHVFNHGYMYQYVKSSSAYDITRENGCCAAAFKEFIFWNGKWFDGGYTTPDYADENNNGGLVKSGNDVTISNGYITIPRLSTLATKTELTDGSVTKVGTATLGSTTKPIYLSSGVPTTGTTYAGGTRVTLNGTNLSGSTATFYAPKTYGSSGHVLIAKGSGASPTFTDVLQVRSNGQQENLGDLTIEFNRSTCYRQIQLVQAGAVAKFDYSSYSSAAVSSTGTIKFVSTSGNVFQRSIVPVFFHKGAKLIIDECTSESSSASDSTFTTVTYTANRSGLVFVGAWPYVFHLSSHEMFDITT